MEDTESVESIHALLSVETGARDAVTGNRRTATKLKAVIAASTALAAATILTVVARGARRGGDSLAMEDQGALSRKFSNQFDCDDGFNDWRSAWSDDKKHWCCHNEGRGCQFDVVSHDVPYSSVRPNHGTPAYHGAPHDRGAVKPAYDCDAGFDAWESAWDEAKQEYCCFHHHRGCSADASSDYDCKAGFALWDSEWSKEKQDYCCSHTGRGCRDYHPEFVALPYDAPAPGPVSGSRAAGAAVPKPSEDCVELRFDLDFTKTDHAAFKTALLDGLLGTGVDTTTAARLRIELRQGSIIAQIRGPPEALGIVSKAPLAKLEVMGCTAEVLRLAQPPLERQDLVLPAGLPVRSSDLEVPIPRDDAPRDYSLCSYEAGSKVSVNLDDYGWSDATVLSPHEHGYVVTVENTGLEERVACGQMQLKAGKRQVVYLAVLGCLSGLAVLIGLGAACGVGERYCGWHPSRR